MKHVNYKGLPFELPDGDEVFGDNIYKFVAEVTRVLSLTEPNEQMVEVGACFGVSSIACARSHRFRRILAVEPDPRNVEYLKRNIELNDVGETVEPVHTAVTDHEGTCRFRPCADLNIGGGVLVWEPEQPQPVDFDVPAVTFDRLCSLHDIDPARLSFVWMDAQGSESRVLTGAGKMLAASRCPWYMELAPALLRRAGATPEAWLAQLKPWFTEFIDMRGEDVRVPLAKLPAVWDVYEQRKKASGKSSHTNLLMFR